MNEQCKLYQVIQRGVVRAESMCVADWLGPEQVAGALTASEEMGNDASGVQ